MVMARGYDTTIRGAAGHPPPPLAIVQARIASTRLPRKMLLDLRGRPLVYHAWKSAVMAFGPDHVVCALPASPENDELAEAIEGFDGRVFRWDGPEYDVLGRFWHCAHTYRWRPDSVIVRVTPDDPRKNPRLMVRVANGERLPVEQSCEAFTLAELDAAHHTPKAEREHLTKVLFSVPPPPAPPGVWTVDTEADYQAMLSLEVWP